MSWPSFPKLWSSTKCRHEVTPARASGH